MEVSEIYNKTKTGRGVFVDELRKELDENITYIYQLFEVRKKEIRGGIEPQEGWNTDTVIDELDTTETEVTTKLKKLLALLEAKK